ncbi:MAG: hypothetical protein KAI73_06750 [Rhodospirillaceae bacterium]|nr:hypothetical protein [Rhodospirillaceae bacterium]
MPTEIDFYVDPDTLISVLTAVLVFLIIYFALLISALVEMIRLDAPGVVIVFTYLSLIPIPPFIILGILNLIIWYFVRRDMMAMRGAGI